MGFFDSSSSSSTTNYNAFTPTVSGNGAVLNGNGDITINATSDRALMSVDNAVNGAFAFGGRALDSVDRSVSQSLATAAAASSAAIAAAQASAREAIGANVTVTSNAMDLTDRAMGTVATSFADSLNYVGHITDMAMAQSNRVDTISAGAVEQVARAYDTATNYQADKATRDNRYLIAVGVIVIGLAAVKMWGKA